MSSLHAERGADNRRLLVRLSIVAVVMFGFGYVLVPFYKQICEAFGLNYVYQRDAAPVNTQIDGTRSVSVELDANTADVPWQFRPLTRHVSVHPGELFTVEYEVVNSSSLPVTGQAVASFGPQIAGRYFKKLECFCFKQQTLAPGETRRMPVVFVIDPRLPRDVGNITLSYTFFEVPGAGERS
ncbi:MAG TPA: cytochrome c oxidase assembly protein [Burkholderiales bacterium]|nr:cytochrome c oxidase assembly protein [Burkholderiales bacterium]